MNWSTNCFAPYHQFRMSILQDSAKPQIMTKFVLHVIATISKMFHFCKSAKMQICKKTTERLRLGQINYR